MAQQPIDTWKNDVRSKCPQTKIDLLKHVVFYHKFYKNALLRNVSGQGRRRQIGRRVREIARPHPEKIRMEGPFWRRLGEFPPESRVGNSRLSTCKNMSRIQ